MGYLRGEAFDVCQVQAQLVQHREARRHFLGVGDDSKLSTCHVLLCLLGNLLVDYLISIALGSSLRGRAERQGQGHLTRHCVPEGAVQRKNQVNDDRGSVAALKPAISVRMALRPGGSPGPTSVSEPPRGSC